MKLSSLPPNPFGKDLLQIDEKWLEVELSPRMAKIYRDWLYNIFSPWFHANTQAIAELTCKDYCYILPVERGLELLQRIADHSTLEEFLAILSTNDMRVANTEADASSPALEKSSEFRIVPSSKDTIISAVPISVENGQF